MQNENERNLHILHRFVHICIKLSHIFIIISHRKAALELEKVRSQRVAKLPLPEDPLRDLQTKPSKSII
jgi:hypothetical protein